MKLLRFLLALSCALPLFGQTPKEALQRNVGTNTVNGSLSSAPFQVATVAALKAVVVANSVTPNGTQVYVTGYYATGDGGQGYFQYSAASVTTDDGGAVIAPNAGNGRWIRLVEGQVNVRWFGVKGDYNGSTGTDDTTALQNAITYTATLGKFSGANIYGGGTLFIPYGCRMKVTSTLNIPGGCAGFEILGENLQAHPPLSQINYLGSTDLPIITVRYVWSGKFATRLTANATIGATAASAVTVSVDDSSFLADGGSIAGKINIVPGTLSRAGSTYTFTRSDTGLGKTFYSGLDLFQPTTPASGSPTPDRFFSIKGIAINGNENAIGLLLEGHGSACYFERLRISGVVVGCRISQPPANGNNEFHSFVRCSITASYVGLDVTDSDAYAITLYGSDISVIPTVSADRAFGAAIRLWDQKISAGMGLTVYGGNIGSSAATTALGNNLINNIAMIEVHGPGDPILIDGARVEHTSTAVRISKADSSLRNVTIKNCDFTGMPGKRLTLFKAFTAYGQHTLLSNGGNSYIVLGGGTSAATGPTSTNGSVETNGSMTVRFVGTDNDTNDWATWSRFVDSQVEQTVTAVESGGGSPGSNVEFHNCTFSSVGFTDTTDSTGMTNFVVGDRNRVGFLGCTFAGRLFEFNPQGAIITRERSIMRGVKENDSAWWVEKNGRGPAVNLLKDNADPSTANWTRGASTANTRNDVNSTQYMPLNGGQGWRIISTSPYDVAAAQIKQETGLTASTNGGRYVARAAQPLFQGNNQLYVKVVDANGLLLGGSIVGHGADIEIPFDTGGNGYSGAVSYVVSSIEGSGSSSSLNFVLRAQIAYRDFVQSYVQSGAYPVDESIGAFPGKDNLTSSTIVANGRLVIPTIARGALQTSKWGQTDGDTLIDSNRRLILNMGDTWTAFPRTFYQAGLTAPTTGIWRIGDQILRNDPTAGAYVGIVCTVAGGFTATGGFAPVDYAIWASTTAVQDGAFRYTTGNRIYRCVRAGTTSGSEPTHTSGVAVDGTVIGNLLATSRHPHSKALES